MKTLFALIICVLVLKAQLEPTITTRWIDAQRIEICTSRSGALYVGSVWAYIGDVEAGCRTFPPPEWELIDIVYAPEQGKTYCLLTAQGWSCAAPLPAPPRYRVILPLISR